MRLKPSTSQKPKQKFRKGLWSPEEDQILKNYVLKHGHGCWSSVPINAELQRNGKSCRLRWINYLRPGLNKAIFTSEEEETIIALHRTFGNKWSQIAQKLSGRTDNDIKNYWHSYLKKRVKKEKEAANEYSSKNEASSSEPTNNSNINNSDNLEIINNISSDIKDQYCAKDAITKLPSCLPKIMFAEWFSLDTFASLSGQHDTFDMARSNTCNKGHYDSITYEDNSLFRGSLYNDIDQGLAFFGFDYHNSLSEVGSDISSERHAINYDDQGHSNTITTCDDQFVIDFTSGGCEDLQRIDPFEQRCYVN